MAEAGEVVLLTVTAEEAGVRLDRFLVGRLAGAGEGGDGGLSRARLQGLIRDGHVRDAAGTLLEPGQRVKPGQQIALAVPAPVAAEPAGQPIALTIAYEDDQLIVVDKPAGMVVHPAAGHADGTLVNALIAHCGESLSGIGGVRRPGIVHRLDKDTSGLIVAAKTDAAHASLAAQFASHGADGRLERAYLALVWGAPLLRKGRIEASLARSTTNRTRIGVVGEARGRRAVTHYEVLETFEAAAGRKPPRALASLIRATLETGRTHQIRVHMAYLGHPLLGDRTYGAGFAASARVLGEDARSALQALGRQALHAAVLGFAHPVSGRPLRFESPLPDDMQRLLGELRKQD